MINVGYGLKKDNKKTNIIKIFLQMPAHSWILKNIQYKNIFVSLLSRLSEKHLNFFFKSNEENLLFIKSLGRFCGAINLIKNQSLVLVYPELLELMRGPFYKQSLGILAHELGHLYLGHSQNDKNPISNQIEADYFSYELGYSIELLDFLNNQNQNHELNLRITHLESYLEI